MICPEKQRLYPRLIARERVGNSKGTLATSGCTLVPSRPLVSYTPSFSITFLSERREQREQGYKATLQGVSRVPCLFPALGAQGT
jgi:hypothetical protein